MQTAKGRLRAEILTARRSVPRQIRDAEADALASRLAEFVAPGHTVCAYVPGNSEPGSLELIDMLVRRDVVVLLPVARKDAEGSALPLQWGRYRPNELVDAPFGLREPAPPWLPTRSVSDAAVVVVPALAVDRSGARLGRGAGFYDRTLPLADPGAALVAVVRDDEFVDQLPAEGHDIPMTHVVTPHAGVVALGR